jgi:ParB-like chromosome segregation protein Spo0J
MISVSANLSTARLPLNRIVVREMEPRELGRIAALVHLMEASGEDIDPLITVRPLDDGYYEVENGHHRFIAYLVAGRAAIPCVIVRE